MRISPIMTAPSFESLLTAGPFFFNLHNMQPGCNFVCFTRSADVAAFARIYTTRWHSLFISVILPLIQKKTHY